MSIQATTGEGKGKKKTRSTDEAQMSVQATEKAAGESVQATENLSAEQKREQWNALKNVDAEIQAIQEKLDEAQVLKSELIREIVISQGAGPFQVPGHGLVTIRSRKGKLEGAPTTFFLVTQGNKQVTVIE